MQWKRCLDWSHGSPVDVQMHHKMTRRISWPARSVLASADEDLTEAVELVARMAVGGGKMQSS
jgi:hypothetical protein